MHPAPDSPHPTPAPAQLLGTSDLRISSFMLGGNVFGWTADEATSFEVLDAFIEEGGNSIDTADTYSSWAPGNNGGESEEIIGNWLDTRGNREDIILATKVGMHPKYSGLRPDTIGAACEASLRRLRTDYIDLYYAHLDDQTVPLEHSVSAFTRLIEEGKVRYIALSNFTPERTEAWLATTAELGCIRPVALQPKYNLMEREFETTLAHTATQHQLGVLPYSALASGFLSGTYRADREPASPRADSAGAYRTERGYRVLAALDAIATRHQSNVAAVALAWLARRPGITAPIVSARSVTQLTQLKNMHSIQLSDEDTQLLDQASAVSDQDPA